jgi:hypothetical protein
MTPLDLPFRCSYELDQRVDKDLVNINQSLYRSLQASLGNSYKLAYAPDGMPDAVQYYLLYVAALIYGAADAVLTLVLHNLGREARILERQVFEYWLRAAYFVEHPEEARIALHSTAFQERALLDQLGYSKDSERYRDIVRVCNEIVESMPEAAKYREPTVRSIIDPKNNEDLARFYALHYRASSQIAHASFNGVGGVWSSDGLSFDSRQADPNLTLVQVTSYLLAFLTLLDKALGLSPPVNLEMYKEHFLGIQTRLGLGQAGKEADSRTQPA